MASNQSALRRQQQLLAHLAKTIDPRTTISHIAVFGSGIMGGGIAQISAMAGYTVTLWDMTDDALASGIKEIKQSLTRVAKKQKRTDNWVADTLARINTTTDQLKAVESADLVIEAIIEKLDIKQQLFAKLDKAAPPNCVFATNTSSLLVGDISRDVSDARKQRFVALHFFNPVVLMQLVEIAYTEKTDKSLMDVLKSWCHSVGKMPVVCRDTPGFIVNRLLVPYNAEARALVERGDASIEDVDVAMRLGAGYPMGPFELADMTGLDTGYHIAKGWYESAPGLKGNPLFKPSPQMEQMIKDGHLGRKTGRGFYTYDQ